MTFRFPFFGKKRPGSLNPAPTNRQSMETSLSGDISKAGQDRDAAGSEKEKQDMTDHIVKSYNEEMEQLSALLQQMGELSKQQLTISIQLFENPQKKEAKKLIKRDRKMDLLNDQVEEQVMRILALRAPVAIDLRETIAALKIARELERIGDLIKNSVKRERVVAKQELQFGAKRITEMGGEVAEQLEAVLSALFERDIEKAMDVWVSDEHIDELCNAVFTEILSGMMVQPQNISAFTQMAFIVKNYERIGDHCTNIAESIYYVLTGDQIEQARPKNDRTSSMIVDPEPDPDSDSKD